MPARILYLHSLHTFDGSHRQKQLENVVGKDNLRAPEMKSGYAVILGFLITYAILVFLLIGTSILCWIFLKWIIGLIVMAVSCTIGTISFFIGNRILLAMTARIAKNRAEDYFRKFKPNIIAASSFGAYVLFKMNVPKVPLLLFGPAQDVYAKFFWECSFPSIKDYPYAIILHGELDKMVPLTHSRRLLESAAKGRCDLKVIVKDNHLLASVKEEELSQIVDELYDRGKDVSNKLAALGFTDVDISLFSDSEESV